jgi:hypothetical protein
MPIVASTLVLDTHTQKDGSRYVKETHVDSEGRSQQALYKLPPGQTEADAQARMTARVAYLDEQLAEAEAQEVLNGA